MTAKLHDGIAALTASVSAGATTTVQPPAGEQWLINAVGLGPFSTADGLVTVGEIYMTDGSNPVLLRKGVAGATPATQAQWGKPMRFGLTNGIYLLLKNNHGMEASRFCYSGAVTSVGTTGVGDIHSAIATGIVNNGTIDIQPPAGEVWALLEVGMKAAQWGSAGGTIGALPPLDIALYNGSNAVSMFYSGNYNIWAPLRIAFTNTTYLRIMNSSGSTTDIGYIAQRIY